MSKNTQNKDAIGMLLVLAAIPITAMLGTAVLWFDNQEHSLLGPKPTVQADVVSSITRLFTPHYPNNQKFKKELKLMRETKKLKLENEVLINKSVVMSTSHLQMPPAILWCLLFQESRLNHLLGLNKKQTVRGLGQFTYFGFYEINHHLDRYETQNLKMFQELLGKDVRPVAALEKNIFDLSSYYFIPTAVTSSAAYLNNRYHQLRRNIEKKNLKYDPGLLWLYATMAYNKGTRSVLSFWNDVQSRGGETLLSQVINDRESFFKTLDEPKWFRRSLGKIWPKEKAKRYANELTIHMQRMRSCSVGEIQKKLENSQLDKTKKN